MLIGEPPDQAYEEADALFRDRRYLDMRKIDDDSLERLVDTLLANNESTSNQPTLKISEGLKAAAESSVEPWNPVQIQTAGEDLPLVRHSHFLYGQARENAMSALRYAIFGMVGIVLALLLNSPPIFWLLQKIPQDAQRANGIASAVEPIRWMLFFAMLAFTLVSLFIVRSSWRHMQEAHRLSEKVSDENV